MPRQITIKNIRKAGAFTGGQLAAGEVGVNTSAPRLEYSADGSAVVALPNRTEALGVVVHGSTASTARPSGFTVVLWIGSVEPTNAATNDIHVSTA